VIKLKYGNTNTFFMNGLLVDTDYAGTLPAFYKVLKANGISIKDISYVLATHYHPDHMGLIGELMEQGVGLLLMDTQKDAVHFSDGIFARDGLPWQPIDETRATLLPCGESRGFLARMGIDGEILSTPSHSPDSVSLILDDGDCFVGDLEPLSWIAAYGEDAPQKKDWARLLALHPKRIFYAHAPCATLP